MISFIHIERKVAFALNEIDCGSADHHSYVNENLHFVQLTFYVNMAQFNFINIKRKSDFALNEVDCGASDHHSW